MGYYFSATTPRTQYSALTADDGSLTALGKTFRSGRNERVRCSCGSPADALHVLEECPQTARYRREIGLLLGTEPGRFFRDSDLGLAQFICAASDYLTDWQVGMAKKESLLRRMELGPGRLAG